MNNLIQNFLEANSKAIKAFRTVFERLLELKEYIERVGKGCSRQKIEIVSYLKAVKLRVYSCAGVSSTKVG